MGYNDTPLERTIMLKLKEIATAALSAALGLAPRGPIDIMISK